MGKGIARKQRFGIMIQKREHPLLVGDLLVVVRPERRDLITQPVVAAVFRADGAGRKQLFELFNSSFQAGLLQEHPIFWNVFAAVR